MIKIVIPEENNHLPHYHTQFTCFILQAGDFVHTLGDAHVYLNHIEPLKEQLTREPRDFPKLKIKRPEVSDINEFKYEDFDLVGYKPHPKIAMEMAV